MSPSLVFRSKCHRSTFSLYRIWQLTFIASYLGNLTFPKVQTILFLNTLSQICCHFHENRCYFIFSTLYNLNIYLWPLKPHNFKSMCRISKIITFYAGWFDLFESDIQALLIFDPLITLWGNFDAPYLKLLNDARVASACFYVRTCRRVRNSKKIATIRDFHLPGSFLCLSTRLLWKEEMSFGGDTWHMGRIFEDLKRYACVWLPPPLWTWNWRAQSIIVWYHGIG